MSKKSKVLMSVATAIIMVFIGKAVIFEEVVLPYLFTFFAVGAGLAALRLFINGMIAKMKGKPVVMKIGFFAALLSVGISFQSWFRTEVIFAMDKAFLVPSIAVLAATVVAMTIFYTVVYKQITIKKMNQVEA